MVFSNLFRDLSSPLTRKIGGVIVVVEKSSEAHELANLCNTTAEQTVATVIESPNDFNLRNGCPNGTATRFEECLRRQCPDYSGCPLAQAASKTEETPILIMLHARYQRHMEDMSPFLTWSAGEQSFQRTLLLVDELPDMFSDSELCIASINEAEIELDQLKASYRAEQKAAKSNILYHWNCDIRIPFFKLLRLTSRQQKRYGLVSSNMRETAGFITENLKTSLEDLKQYAEGTLAGDLVDVLLSDHNIYYAVGQSFSLFLPRLKKIDTSSQLATFIFSGTAVLSPEVADNPGIALLTDEFEESYQRLTVFTQRGDGFSASKTALDSYRNREGVLEWLRFILPQLATRHKKVLMVTYQNKAADLWAQLTEFQDILIPYIDNEGHPSAMLPYFGGVTGSNRYQEATCVICVGLNRFEPREYLSRTLALDFTGEAAREFQTAEEEQNSVRLDQLPRVMGLQDITLARDIVQLVFRSALRRHGEEQPIELWLLHPPNGVLAHLKSYFGDCRIEEIPELPESCQLAATVNKTYKGNQTHAGKLLAYLNNWDGKGGLTPDQIRNDTGLSLSQFKEAKKNPTVQDYFDKHITTKGSGRNAVYSKKVS